MKNRKVAVVCGIVGAVAGIAAGIGKIISVQKQKEEKKPWDKPGRDWEV